MTITLRNLRTKVINQLVDVKLGNDKRDMNVT